MPIEVTRRLAEFAVGTRFAALSPELVASAKLAIADSIGTVLAGTGEHSVVILRDWARQQSPSGRASVLGCGMTLPAAHAAFVNAATAHALDYDNISLTVSGFVATPALFALLAVAEEEEGAVSGRTLIEAFVAGYEAEAGIARGLGVAHYAEGWHSTSTLAHFGATIAVGRLLGFDLDAMRCAIGITASESSGLRDMVGNMLKAFHVAKAARNGITAARLTQMGFTGHPSALEIDWGYCRAFNGTGNFDPAAIVDTLGRPWDLLDPGLVIKVYPCCGLIHSALDGVIDLVREHDIRPDQVRHVRVSVHELVPPTMANDDPKSGYEGKFSTAFCVANAIVERSTRLAHFTDARVADPAIRTLMGRVEMVVHPELRGYATFLQKEFTDVRFELTDGRVLEQRVMRMNNRGSKGRPIGFAELRDKFIDCTSAHPNAARALEAFGLLEKLEDVPDVREIAALMR